MMHKCPSCVKADNGCLVFGDVDHVGTCIEYRPKLSWVDEILKPNVARIDVIGQNGNEGAHYER